jgi:hypothetical protein
MNEKRWALIGKVLVIFSIAVGLILGLFQLTDRLRAPSVFAVVEFRRDHTNPQILDNLKERIETKKLLDLIETRKKKGETPDKILQAIKTAVSKKELGEFDDLIIDMDFSGLRTMMEFEVGNNGSSLAKDVRLILPGDGVAEIIEHLGGKQSKKIDWSDQIPLGDIRPKAKLGVKVWPKSMIFASFNLTNPAIVHSGGTGKVMEAHSFYGWDADLVAWFVARGLIFQVISAAVALTIIIMIVWFAIRRGYVVLRPAKHP